ncbi:MAG: extracellular solute-binding protein [Ardenticatenaceae bacterium]|nr:extracellular solute-binding protein [Ardenticatenaceae bacterium]
MSHQHRMWLLALIVIVAVLVGCAGQGAAPTTQPTGAPAQQGGEQPTSQPSSGEAQHEPVTLTYWTAGPNPPLSTATEDLVKEFMNKYPWITVNVQNFAFGEYFQKIDTATAGGNAPDVFWVDNTQVPIYVYNDVIIPLDDYVQPGYADDLFPIPKADMTYNGKIWALPMHQSTEAILYNEDMIKAAGLEPPQSYDQAWKHDQWVDAITKVTEKSGDVTNVWGWTTFYPVGTYSIEPWQYARGAQYLNDEGTTYTGYTNGEASVESLGWIGSLFKQGLSPIERVPDIFQTGKVAFIQANPFVLTDIQQRYPDLKVGVMPIPCEQRCAVPSGGYHIGIHSQSKHPQEGWMLVDFLTSKEGHKEWIEKTGYMPARKSVYEEMPNLKEYPLSIFMEGLANHAVRRPINEAWPVFNDTFTSAVENVITGADPKAELDKVTQAAQEELDRYKK